MSRNTARRRASRLRSKSRRYREQSRKINSDIRPKMTQTVKIGTNDRLRPKRLNIREKVKEERRQ